MEHVSWTDDEEMRYFDVLKRHSRCIMRPMPPNVTSPWDIAVYEDEVKKTWACVHTEMNWPWGPRPFTLEQLRYKLEELQSRYDLFSALLSHPNITWDRTTNAIRASPYFPLFHPSAARYAKHGEKHWDHLRLVFEEDLPRPRRRLVL